MTTPPSPATADVRKALAVKVQNILERELSTVPVADILGTGPASFAIADLLTCSRAPQPLGTPMREGIALALWKSRGGLEKVWHEVKQSPYKFSTAATFDIVQYCWLGADAILALHPLPGKEDLQISSPYDRKSWAAAEAAIQSEAPLVCPKCDNPTSVHALADSDLRIYSSWRYCSCGWAQAGPDGNGAA
jgi:hypothetical protein